MASGGFVCMMRTERDMLLVSSEAFSGSMMSERWDFRWEAGDNSVKLDADIEECRFMSRCVRWRCIGGVVCGGVVASESQFLAKPVTRFLFALRVSLGYKKDVVFREGNHVFVLRCCRIKSEHSKVSVKKYVKLFFLFYLFVMLVLGFMVIPY